MIKRLLSRPENTLLVTIFMLGVASSMLVPASRAQDETQPPVATVPSEKPEMNSGQSDESATGNEEKGETARDSNSIRLQAEEIRQRAEKLIVQLGDPDYETRDLAEEELQKFAVIVRSILEKATQSEDPEIAGRASVILSSLPEPDHTILDALGAPIAFAQVNVDIHYVKRALVPDDGSGKPESQDQEKRLQLELLSDDKGGIAIGEFDGARLKIVVRNDLYGTAKIETNVPRHIKNLKLPLVNKSSEAFKRAAKGQVVNATGEPIAGAEISCGSVRTPGEGLIQAEYPSPVALTDDEGRFAYYLPSEKDERRGELIPENSNFQLTATMPDSTSVVPVGAICNNRKPTKLVIATDSILHRFEFETADGKQPSEQDLISQFHIQYKTRKDGHLIYSKLDAKSAATGIRLAPGTYTAVRYVNGNQMHYQPIEVTKTSHELLTFKMPPPVTFRGRLIHGVTREPIKEGFVIGYSSTSRGSLAMLTPDDWKALKKIKSNADPDSDELKRLKEFYGVKGIVRTKTDGTFKIVQPTDREFYGLIAFDEGMIPFSISGFYLKDKESGKTLQRDYPMFPAALLLVNPVDDSNRIGVTPHWVFDKQGQPDWVNRIEQATEETHGDFQFKGWMRVNELQPIFIPAGLKVRVKFRTPYSEGTAPYTMPESVQLEAGETKEIGEIRFQSTLTAVVRVVDKNGNPVEGVPVRRLDNEERSWSIAHNTDADGMAIFGLNPNSTGKFRAGESHGRGEVVPEMIEFSVKETAPTKTFELKLSDEKIRKILQK